MPIVCLEKEQLFFLSGGDTSYVLGIYKNCYPVHLYWGSRIPATDIRWYLEAPYRRKKLIESTEPDDPMFTREFWPFEYPSYGSSDFRPPAYEIRDEDGYGVTDLRYQGYTIQKGKPDIPGLPSVYCESPDEVETLSIQLLDVRTGLQVDLFYSLYEQSGIVTRHTVFRNTGNRSIQLQSALSVSMDFKHSPYAMLQLSGTALREHYIEKRILTNGETSFESLRGISSHQQNPFMVLVDENTTEYTGNAYGLSLIYSDNFLARVSCDMYHSARVQLGIHPSHFSWMLQPGDRFDTPEAVLCYSPEGLTAMSQKLHWLFRKRLYKGEYRDQPRPIVLNTWEAAYFDFNHDKIMELAQKAAQVGVELLVLDDGWFGKRNNDTSSLGDWWENTLKLPYGLKGLAEQINQLGMAFGLWFEPEMISPDSELYRMHPDWCIHIDGCKRTEWRHQLVLDLSRSEVCDYLIDNISKVLASANIAYVKWDCNRRITEPGSQWLGRERQDELMHRYVLGLYRIMKTLTERFPHILFENCASGGARMDPGMMAYFPQTWVSDNTDAVCRLKIQYGTSLCYPPVMTTAHVSICPNHQMKRQEPWDFRGHVSFPFNLGYELNLCQMTNEELEEIYQQISLYKEIRSLVQQGNFFRLSSPFEGNYTAWMTCAQDQSEALVWFYKPIAEPEEAYIQVRLKGLKADAIYRCIETGEEFYGSILMQIGLPIEWKIGDYFSQMWHFIIL